MMCLSVMIYIYVVYMEEHVYSTLYSQEAIERPRKLTQTNLTVYTIYNAQYSLA